MNAVRKVLLGLEQLPAPREERVVEEDTAAISIGRARLDAKIMRPDQHFVVGRDVDDLDDLVIDRIAAAAAGFSRLELGLEPLDLGP